MSYQVSLGDPSAEHIWGMPNVVILAGANGAGKTSAAPVLLRDELRVSEFVNADVIARGLSGFDPDLVAVEAGRVMLRRLEELVAARADFAFETTLSGGAFLSSLARWRAVGYTVHIIYLWLPSADLAINRVHQRHSRGGHSVPDDVVRRRHARGLSNFANSYRSAADSWQLYDNTNPPNLIAVARGVGDLLEVVDADRWAQFQKAASLIPRIREAVMAIQVSDGDNHIARWFSDPSNGERAMRVVYARVIRRHRLLNQPIVTMRDGQVVKLDPHTVPMPEEVTEQQIGNVFDYF